MRKYITEFIGTFFLVLSIGMLVSNKSISLQAPFAIGSILMAMVFAGGHISGAHYNPAVTLAALIRGRIKISDALPYMGSQILGAVAASFVAGIFVDFPQTAQPQNLDVTRALLGEVLGTFALAYVVLNVATAKGTAGNSNYGLAIGFTVLAMAYTFGGYSGGAFNPAVAIGASIMNLFEWSNIWLYIVGCMGGAAIAAFVFNYLNPDDK